ncbi:thioesterase [bacterium TMED277]|nr:MAG: thioesterase [bacterium TMED277]
MFVTNITPRVSETDGVGHINNVFIPIWFEAGRREIFRIFSPNLDFKNWRLALVKVEVEYVDQIYLANDVKIRTGIENIGNSSFTITEEIHQTNRLCAKGKSIYVNYNFKTKKSESVPEEIREKLEKYHLS